MWIETVRSAQSVKPTNVKKVVVWMLTVPAETAVPTTNVSSNVHKTTDTTKVVVIARAPQTNGFAKPPAKAVCSV